MSASESAAARPRPLQIALCNVPPPGEGRVCIYEIKKGFPHVINPPKPEQLKGMKFLAVHFGSRRWVLCKYEKDFREMFAEIKKGHNPQGILPPSKKKRAAKKVARAQPRAAVDHEPPPPPPQPSENQGGAAVTADMSFDEAMQTAFPVRRLMLEFERLLKAEEPVFGREGEPAGTRPVFATQFQALKALTEWHQGRPGEKEKPPQEKKRLSHDELIAWLESNEDAVDYMEEVINRAKVKQALAKQKGAAPVKV